MDIPDQEIEALLARCALRDTVALKQLYNRLGGYLNAIAFRLLKAEDLSNDVLQETFVQIWQNAGNYRADLARPLTWMASIVRYRALDRLAKEKRHWERELVDDADSTILENIDGGDEPEKRVQESKVRGLIRDCLAMLSDRSRRCVELAYLEGYSRDELAAMFNTNTNTIKSWLYRSAERLKSCLETKMAYRL